MENILIEKQLKAAADLNRVKLLACMKNGEVCVCDFVDVLGISQPAVSQHLRKLKEADTMTERKVGTWKHYRLVENQTPLMKDILEQIQPLYGGNCGTDCCHLGEMYMSNELLTKQISFLDRYLSLWIFISMGIGVLLNF